MRHAPTITVPFTKMHGLGNDFVIFDARATPMRLDDGQARGLADRHTGIGCDQIIVIEPAATDGADAFMRIYNADGGEVEACGNAARCVADLLMAESGRSQVTLVTSSGTVVGTRAVDGLVAMDMGEARCDWADIPLAAAQDTAHVQLAVDGLEDPVAVNIGNPHAVFFVNDADRVPLATVGPRIEHHALFPERTNVEIVAVAARDHLRMRVWERGVGITKACGTGACAALVAAHRRGLAERRAIVTLDGGPLEIFWRDDNHVIMTGPAATAFVGAVTVTQQV